MEGEKTIDVEKINYFSFIGGGKYFFRSSV